MNIIITAGGTKEKIDDVRAISNSSTGRLGAAIAQAFIKSDKYSVDKMYYICGMNSAAPLSEEIITIRINGVIELISQIESILAAEKIDIFIHSMAVSDYAVNAVTTKSRICDSIKLYLNAAGNEFPGDAHSIDELASKIVAEAFDSTQDIKSSGKISSDIDDLIIEMKKTPKVIGMIKKLQPETLLVGFKLLSNVDTGTLLDIGYDLLQKNSCDLVLANDLIQITDEKHTGYLISTDKTYKKLETKEQIAEAIASRTFELLKNKEKEYENNGHNT